MVHSSNKKIRPIIISVEAAIASGKSTLLELVKQQFGDRVFIVQEPVTEWQRVGGNEKLNALDKFYKDPKRWSYSFQALVFLTRVQAVENAIETLEREGKLENTVIVVERSYTWDRQTFGRMLKDSDDINELEWSMYEDWSNWLITKAPDIIGHVYMRTSVDTVMKRLGIRNRGEETGIERSYQERLISYHDQWVKKLEAARVPMCTLNANVDFLHEEEEWNKLYTQLNRFFHEQCLPKIPERAKLLRGLKRHHSHGGNTGDTSVTEEPRPLRRQLKRHITDADADPRTSGGCESEEKVPEPLVSDIIEKCAAPEESTVPRRRVLRAQPSY